MQELQEDVLGLDWENSARDVVLRLRDDPARPRDMRAWLCPRFEVPRVLYDRLKAINAGAPAGVDVAALGDALGRDPDARDVLHAEWAARAMHAPGKQYVLERALPTGCTDVVRCRNGQWTVERRDSSNSLIAGPFFMEVAAPAAAAAASTSRRRASAPVSATALHAPTVDKFWFPAPSG